MEVVGLGPKSIAYIVFDPKIDHFIYIYMEI